MERRDREMQLLTQKIQIYVNFLVQKIQKLAIESLQIFDNRVTLGLDCLSTVLHQV